MSTASMATAQGAPIPSAPLPASPYSTHDWSDQTSQSLLPEAWIDTKTPGNGRTYSVGNIVATNTDPAGPVAPTFSGQPIGPPPGVGTWQSGARSISVLQCTEAPSTANPSGIVWQQFYFGTPPNFMGLPNNFVGLHCHARGISVFAQPTAAATRIAICGETYDESLPLGGGFVRTNYAASAGIVGGFLAVFDGDGALLWSRLYCGANALAGTTITDVSIRVETVGGVPRDVVTFCGATQGGYYFNPASSGPRTITPINAFAAPPADPLGHQVVSGGATSNGPSTEFYEWDGLIGRVWQDQAPAVLTGTDFLCTVGGGFQDGLFGVSELDANRFAVVGTTANLTRPASIQSEFPLTTWSTFNDPSTFNSFTMPIFQMGVLMVFDARNTRNATTPNLILERSELIGSRTASTVARDVQCQGGMIFAVGSTNDANFTQPFPSAGLSSLNGVTDGYVLVTAPLLAFQDALFVRGYGAARDELTGIGGWNEYADHVTVVGRTAVGTSNADLFVTRILLDTTAGVSTSNPLSALRAQIITTDGAEVIAESPSQWFAAQALTRGASGSSIGGPYENGLVLGAPYGGGVGVDQRARATLVGTTFSHEYPVEGGGRVVTQWITSQNIDGIRTELDLLPYGVGRTDRTSGLFPAAFVPTSGNGGTTPVASLAPFGLQIGGPAFDVQRMMIDFEGLCSPGAQAAILIDRPPTAAGGYGSFLQLGFPSSTPVAVAGMPGVEVWTNNSPVFTYYPPHVGTLRLLLWPGGLPSGSYAFSLQFLASLTGPIPFSATPAISFHY